MQWLTEHWLLVLPMVLGAIAVARLMPKGEPRSLLLARLLGLTAVGLIGGTLLQPSGAVLDDILFFLFAGVAVLSASLMITNRNPAYSALWFAIVTLAVCGLFLLQSAPFLASATVIVYAGAIIVIFLFVLMLAQQAGTTNCDQQARDPGLAAFTGFVLLGALLYVLLPQNEGASSRLETGVVSFAPKVAAATPATKAAVTINRQARAPTAMTMVAPTAEAALPPESSSVTAPENYGTMRGLGRSLFGDYLLAVELAGTLLLIASIGAIVIAPKRSSGKL